MGEEDLPEEVRALKLLDAAESGDDDGLGLVNSWVVEAARAHDAALPRAGDVRPLDLAGEPRDALWRLDILVAGGDVVSGWFIDAALGRGLARRLSTRDAALLEMVRHDKQPVDWIGRLARVDPSAVAGSAE